MAMATEGFSGMKGLTRNDSVESGYSRLPYLAESKTRAALSQDMDLQDLSKAFFSVGYSEKMIHENGIFF